MTQPTQAQIAVALQRARTILANMALENEGAIFNRWPISHEPLRGDARNALPEIDAALTAAAQVWEPLPSVNWDKEGKAYSYCPECGREEYKLGFDVATIEHCAQVADEYGLGKVAGIEIAAAIRKMKGAA